jgi:hypothetical protein
MKDLLFKRNIGADKRRSGWENLNTPSRGGIER